MSDNEKELKVINTACTLDCWDGCSILATVRNNKIESISGDPRNHITGNFLCVKGLKHVEMQRHPKRLRQPMIKKNSEWTPCNWDFALDYIADKLNDLRKSGPTTALLHCQSAGNVGLLKKVENRFFNAYGGVTTPMGSLCAGAGSEAQKYDFGRCLSHEVSDFVNSKTIIIWGRNPANTGIHVMPFLKEAKKNGAKIILIDPIETETAKYADIHLSPLPGTDGALALTIANMLICKGLIDQDFIDNHIHGFDEFKESVKAFTLEEGSRITGVPIEKIEMVVDQYGSSKPSAIIEGFGLQRYSNGGYTVRAIDALGAITGNIGISGGGVSYNNHPIVNSIDSEILLGEKYKKYSRSYPWPKMADFILNAYNPDIKVIFTTRANPLTQGMNSNLMMEAFSKVGFKVTIDMFMTDTALMSDIVLPCSHFLEDKNIVMPPENHNYITYCNPVVKSEDNIPNELWIYNELAKRLKLENFPIENEDWWLERAIRPLTELTGIALDDLKDGPIILPGTSPVPWKDRIFKTPSEKYELYSQKAMENGYEPLPIYKEISIELNEKYPFYLLTPHTKHSLHSQHFVNTSENHLPVAYIHSETGLTKGIKEGSEVYVSTELGKLLCTVEYKDSVRKDIVMIYEGWWISKSGGVNQLIPEVYSEMGCHAAYYECACNIK